MKSAFRLKKFTAFVGLLFCLAFGVRADWTLTDSTLTDGNWSLMVNASGGNYTVTGCSTGFGDLDLRNTGLNITAIGASAFYGKTSITNVFLPDTVTSIGDAAFRQMSGLTNIVLSANLGSLGGWAFFWDGKLASVTPFLPDSVATVGKAAFDSCSALTGDLRICNPTVGVSLPADGIYATFRATAITSADLSSVTNIDMGTFRQTALTNVVLSSSLQSIGDDAFYACSQLVTVTPFLPDTVTTIGREAFLSCGKLKGDLRLCNPNSKIALPSSVFHGTSLTSADLSSVTNIGVNAVRQISTLTNVVLSCALQSIGFDAFYSDGKLANITPLLPDSLVSLGNEAFWNCTALTNDLVLGLGKKAVTFGTTAFANTKIQSATLGVMVTNVPSSAFAGCSSLRRASFGGCPTLAAASFPSVSAYWIRCYIPKYNADWESFAATGVVALTAGEIATFQTAYPAEELPLGTWVPPGAGTTQWYCTWTPPQYQHKGTAIYLR